MVDASEASNLRNCSIHFSLLLHFQTQLPQYRASLGKPKSAIRLPLPRCRLVLNHLLNFHHLPRAIALSYQQDQIAKISVRTAAHLKFLAPIALLAPIQVNSDISFNQRSVFHPTTAVKRLHSKDIQQFRKRSIYNFHQCNIILILIQSLSGSMSS